MKNTSVFVHGFLGLPTDWQHLPNLPHPVMFRSLADDIKYLKADISFTSWISYFLQTSPERMQAYGYSLGGRLLLAAYLHQPERFTSLTLFSTNYGLSTEAEKQQRWLNDSQWAERFLNEHWDSLLQAWNGQTVFNGHFVARNEKDFDRQILAKMLTAFSLGKQDFLLAALLATPPSIPIHFVMGEKDVKFMSLLKAIPAIPNVYCHSLPNASHRIPWDYSMTGQEKWWHPES